MRRQVGESVKLVIRAADFRQDKDSFLESVIFQFYHTMQDFKQKLIRES